MTIPGKTALARPLDPKDPGNILIITITTIVFLTSAINQYISAETVVTAILTGFQAALTVFMSWAISRELDPDHSFSAFVPVSLVLVVIYFSGVHSILPLFWVIALLRITNHTAGTGAGIPDILFVSFLGILLAFNASVMYGLLTGIGLLANSRISQPDNRYLVAGLLVAIISSLFLMSGNIDLPVFSFSGYWILIAITILFIPVILESFEVRSVGDKNGKRLDPGRVQLAQLMALIIVIFLSLWDTNSWLYVMYCILAGIGIYWIFSGKVTVN